MVTILAVAAVLAQATAPCRACAAETAVARQRRRAHQGPRQVARKQPRRRLARSRRRPSIYRRATRPTSHAGIRSSTCCTATVAATTRSTAGWRRCPTPPTNSRPQAAAKEMIVVTPSAYTLHKGSMYSNSPTTGDWEVVRRRRPRRLHGQPLPNDSRTRLSARSRRPLDGRLRRAADRHEAPRRVLGALPHELVLSERHADVRSGPHGAGRSDQDARSTPKRPDADEASDRRVTLAEGAAWSPNPKQPAALSRSSRQGRHSCSLT